MSKVCNIVKNYNSCIESLHYLKLKEISQIKVIRFQFEYCLIKYSFHEFVKSSTEKESIILLEILYELRNDFTDDNFLKALEQMMIVNTCNTD